MTNFWFSSRFLYFFMAIFVFLYEQFRFCFFEQCKGLSIKNITLTYHTYKKASLCSEVTILFLGCQICEKYQVLVTPPVGFSTGEIMIKMLINHLKHLFYNNSFR